MESPQEVLLVAKERTALPSSECARGTLTPACLPFCCVLVFVRLRSQVVSNVHIQNTHTQAHAHTITKITQFIRLLISKHIYSSALPDFKDGLG